MKRFTGAVLGVLVLVTAASAYAAEHGVAIAKAIFDQRTYEVYQDWIAERVNLTSALRNTRAGSDEKTQYWIDTCVLKPATHETEDAKHILTFTGGVLEPETARSFLRAILQAGFANQVSRGDWEAMKGAREKIEDEIDNLKRELDKIEKQREELTRLRSSLSRDVRQEEASIESELSSANLRCAELEARLESITKRLAQEKPVLKSPVVEGSTEDKVLELIELMVKASIREAESAQANIGTDSDRHAQFIQNLDKTRSEMISMITEFGRSVQGRVNPVYQKLKEMLVEAETEYAGLVARRDFYDNRKIQKEEVRGELDKIESQIDELEDRQMLFDNTAKIRKSRLNALRDEFPLEQPVIEWLDIPQIELEVKGRPTSSGFSRQYN